MTIIAGVYAGVNHIRFLGRRFYGFSNLLQFREKWYHWYQCEVTSGVVREWRSNQQPGDREPSSQKPLAFPPERFSIFRPECCSGIPTEWCFALDRNFSPSGRTLNSYMNESGGQVILMTNLQKGIFSRTRARRCYCLTRSQKLSGLAYRTNSPGFASVLNLPSVFAVLIPVLALLDTKLQLCWVIVIKGHQFNGRLPYSGSTRLAE